MNRLVEKCRRTVQRKGMRACVGLVWQRLAAWWFRRRTFYLLTMPTAGPYPSLRRRPAGLTFCEIDKHDAASIAFVSRHRRRVFGRYFRGGALGFAERLKGEIVSYIFLSTRGIREFELGFDVPVKRRQVYLFDLATRKDVRGRGVGVEMLLDLAETFNRRGVDEFVALVEDSNIRSRRNLYRVGFRPFDKMCCVTALGGLIRHAWRIGWAGEVEDPMVARPRR